MINGTQLPAPINPLQSAPAVISQNLGPEIPSLDFFTQDSFLSSLAATGTRKRKKEAEPEKPAKKEEAPVEEAPVEKAPVEKAPVEKAPVEEVPVEEVPAEEAPVEEAAEEVAGQDDSGSQARHLPRGVPENAIRITILHTNDLHGTTERFPALSEAIQELKKENPETILVDSGDLAYSARATDESPFEPVIEYLNDNGYFAIVPGNHDFQWGKEEATKEFFSKLKSEVLCANILDKDTGMPLPGTKPHVIKEIQGVKVAFIGVTTTKMATNEHPDIGEDLIALNEVGILEREIALSRNEGAQVFIALVHKGATAMTDIRMLVKKLPELDVMVIGHDHEVGRSGFRTGTFPHRTYIVEAGCYGNFIGKVDVYIDPESKHVLKAQMKTIPTSKYDVIDPTASLMAPQLELPFLTGVSLN